MTRKEIAVEFVLPTAFIVSQVIGNSVCGLWLHPGGINSGGLPVARGSCK
jgi:hypothetical protein